MGDPNPQNIDTRLSKLEGIVERLSVDVSSVANSVSSLSDSLQSFMVQGSRTNWSVLIAAGVAFFGLVKYNNDAIVAPQTQALASLQKSIEKNSQDLASRSGIQFNRPDFEWFYANDYARMRDKVNEIAETRFDNSQGVGVVAELARRSGILDGLSKSVDVARQERYALEKRMADLERARP